MSEDVKVFFDLLSESKKREKILSDFLIEVYTDIKNKNPVKLKQLLKRIENTANQIPDSEINRYLHLYKMRYDD